MNDPAAPRCEPTRAFAWIAVLLVALGFVAWDAAARRDAALRLSANYGVTVDAPAVDPRSPTGYVGGRRSLILPGRSLDGYHWIMQTQAMVAAGDARVRHVDYDDPPSGREVHWAQPFRWWLVTLAWLDHHLAGSPWGIALERAALLSGPALLALLLLTVTPRLARRFSPVAAAWFAAGTVAAYPFYIDFAAGYPDHHGLVNSCALLSVLLLAGADGPRARRSVIAAAIAGGIALWISAATEAPVLIGLGLGAALACWLGRGPQRATIWSQQPELFRWWGATGAAVSLAAYLIEYAPAHFGLRLEVNHPLYALAWAGAGEALCRLARILGRNPGAPVRTDLRAGCAAVGAAAVLPVVLVFTHARTFVVADPLLWRLHADFIAEFQGLLRFLQRSGYSWEALGYCLPPLFLAPAAWLAWRGRLSPGARAALALALLPAGVALLLTWSQVRWWSLAFALIVPVVAVVFRTLHTEPARPRRAVALWSLGAALLLAPGLIDALQRATHGPDLTDDDVRALAERDLAHWLRQRTAGGSAVVAASPTISTALIFHGGLTGVGTLYWENLDGLKAAAALYAASTDAAAHAIVKQCGITHVVIVTWDGFEGVYTRLARGLPAEAPLPADAFVVRLLSAPTPPAWLRPVAFPLPAHPAFAGQQIRIYEVTSDLSVDESLIAMAACHLEAGAVDRAEALAPALAAQAGRLPASTMLATLAARRNDPAAFASALAHVRTQLAQAPALSLEDHIRLVAVLALGEEFALARTQVEQLFPKITPDELRHLPASALGELLSFSRAAVVLWPDDALRRLAVSLQPPPQRR